MVGQVVVKRSKLRNFLMWGFHMLVVFVAGGRVRDTQCGFKVRQCGCWPAASSEAVAPPPPGPLLLYALKEAPGGHTLESISSPCASLTPTFPVTPAPRLAFLSCFARHPPLLLLAPFLLRQLFTRRAAAVLYSNQRLQRWCFDVELLYLAEQLQVRAWGSGLGARGLKGWEV